METCTDNNIKIYHVNIRLDSQTWRSDLEQKQDNICKIALNHSGWELYKSHSLYCYCSYEYLYLFHLKSC